MQYEVYGNGRVGILVAVMCSNRERISSEIRIATNKRGGTIAHPGAVAFNFDRKGVIVILKKNAIVEELFEKITEAGAEDFLEEDDHYIITCDPADLLTIKEAVATLGF